MSKNTPLLSTMLHDMDGGVFDEKCGAFLAAVASAVSTWSGKGSVRITLTPKRIGNGSQLLLTHKVEYHAPTAKGVMTECDVTETPMHVHKTGVLSLFPAETTGDMFPRGEAPPTQHPQTKDA